MRTVHYAGRGEVQCSVGSCYYAATHDDRCFVHARPPLPPPPNLPEKGMDTRT